MKPFIKNWSYLVTSDVITKFLGFFATIILARNLNPDGYGAYNVILAISAIFTVVANFGMTQVLTREIARNVEISGVIFLRASLIRIFSVILSVIGIYAYFKIFESKYDDIYIIVTCILTISITAWDLFESIAFGRQVMKYSAVLNIFSSVIWVLCLFLLPKELFSILNIVGIYAGIDLLKALAYYFLIYKKGFLKKISIEIAPNAKQILMMSLPYLWLWGLGIFSNQVPILFLSKNSGQEEVGYFSIGLRLILPLTIVTNTAMKAIFPNLSVLYKENIEKFRSLVSDGIIVIVFLGSILAFILTVFSIYYIPFLFGEKYLNSVMPFNFLLWFMVLYSMDVLLGTSLSASDRQVILSFLGTIDFIISIPIMYIGAKYGAYYLAISKLIVAFILVSYHWIILKKVIYISWFKYFSLLLFFFIMCLFSFQNIFENIVIQFLVFFIIIVIFLKLKKLPFKEIRIIINKLK